MIFVAVAVAWCLYLIPKAMRQHEDVAGARAVDKFSDTIRVLARREPVSDTDAALVVPGATQVAEEPISPAQLRARRAATRRATQRRRRVFLTLVGANALVALLGVVGILGWVWQSIPAGLLVVWLVLCRVMVKSERALTREMLRPKLVEESESVEDAVDLPETYEVARNEQGFDEVCEAAATSTFEAIDEELWDPVPVTLPTYVGKEKAGRRTVRTIDLGASDAWTSGRTEEATAVAREADAVASADRHGGEEPRRAVGS